ncbi:3'(2'), 5'-bisphosphate nucleotidase [Kribbella sp. VKM Ac-2527]|uniref:3'(2'), 5'-bisphosphate nucleotidase n=1 Tax=Kribbella caucasensis TaxID=2512215 RepID=A0A4R6K6A9_9ACTN|nr:3'(2'),5'-bisphosphate nucleotidase CysQ [Kribbella sp. VKM Ac-2527]TDO43366.1 3'(2'), 5'-bisphosphate nucleotidase [Kribbella sp. VKM Ac-2527]
MGNREDGELAAELAAAAGELLLELRTGGETGRDLGARGDRLANELLIDGLRARRPNDAVLSEESADSPARLSARRVWIIDPLDGTREYGELPRLDWAVHVALWEDGDLAAGAVALPAIQLVHDTNQSGSLPPRLVGPTRIAVSRTRPPALVHALAGRIDAELVPMGSAGVKATAVLRGEVDAYVHAGGQYEWDSAAPVAVARAAGVHCSRIDGSPLRYNRPDPKLPDLLICRPEIAEELLSAIAGLEFPEVRAS